MNTRILHEPNMVDCLDDEGCRSIAGKVVGNSLP